MDRNQKIIEKLLSNKYLEKRNDDLYVFVKDYVFNSPSAASDIVCGKTLEKIYKK
ncbi:MAG TPA: hypothetical protein DEP08_01765 [Candidatus Jacksonbacteria bacterium]|nr:hypothetical protein [Candidatus Jacksonbacteria bacterium]